MTLAEWKKENPEVDVYEKDSNYFISDSDLDKLDSKATWNLYHLSDYVVRGVSAGTTWLYPRLVANPEITNRIIK